MKPVRLGIIGCGVIGTHHVELASKSPGVKIVAVADLIRDRARAAAEKAGIAACYRNDEELLKEENVEAVVLAMPTGVRSPVAFKVLRRGKHMLLEKPVANNAGEVKKMMAMRGDLVVGCCSSRYGFSGHADAAIKCVKSGALGKLRLVRIRAIHGASAHPVPEPPPWRESMKLNGGGILVNWSCYGLDYVMRITGWRLQPKTVLAHWWPVAKPMKAYAARGSDADAHYTALIMCKDDIVLSMERAEFSSASVDQAWEIVGTDGTLHLPMRLAEGEPNAVILDKFVPGKGIVSKTLWKEGQGKIKENVLTDFACAIRKGGETRTNLERALIMQKITDAIYASAASGASVPVR